MLGRHVVVLHSLRLVERRVQNARELRRHRGLLLRAFDARLRRERRLGMRAQRVRVGDELARQLLVEEREHEVLGIELGVAHAARQLLRGCDRFLGLDRELVEVHQRLSGSISSR